MLYCKGYGEAYASAVIGLSVARCEDDNPHLLAAAAANPTTVAGRPQAVYGTRGLVQYI